MTGVLDFKCVILLGNLLYIVAVLVIVYDFRKKEGKQWHIMPLVYAACALHFYIVTICEVLFLYNIAFGVFAMWFLLRKTLPGVIVAGILAVASSFNGGNGFMILLVGLVFLLLQRSPRLWVAGWLVLVLATIAVLFSGFSFDKIQGHETQVYSMQSITMIFSYLAVVLSSGLFIDRGAYLLPVGLVISLASLIAIFFLVKNKYYQRNPLLSSFILFMLASAVCITMVRWSLTFYQAAFARYKIFSLLFLGAIIVALIDAYRDKVNKIIPVILVVASCAFWGRSVYYNMEGIEQYNEFGRLGAMLFHENNSVSKLYYPVESEARAILSASATAGIYHYPRLGSMELSPVARIHIPKRPSRQDVPEVTVLDTGKHLVFVEGYFRNDMLDQENDSVYLSFAGASGEYSFSAHYFMNYTEERPFIYTWNALVRRDLIPGGEYSLLLVVSGKSYQNCFELGKVLYLHE